MHRVLALLLVPALIATSGSSVLHTHAYTDHDHPEHHHGLSVDHHDGTPTPAGDDAARLDECDPALHKVPFALACAAPPQQPAVDAEGGSPASFSPEVKIEPAVGNPDVRVHGPPRHTQPPPRAPPLEYLA